MKEKYKEIVCGFNDERTENVANRCVEIAEEFTIEFAEWINNSLFVILWRRGSITTEKLLEIFKNEKAQGLSS